MSKARVAVLKVISKELTVTSAAEQYGYSRRHLHRLLARYQTGGLDAVDPRSRRPHASPQQTSDEIRSLIIELRLRLTREGFDAGPVTIAWHLEQAGHWPPSTSTIRRILHAAGLITPEPRKRPRSSYRRFAAAQPNECWQSDFTHWHLADGTDVEILNWLDDHSRFLLGCTAHTPVTGDIVTQHFLSVAELQHQLDEFRDLYNEHRPHRARQRSTPGKAYRALPKAEPTRPRAPRHYRLRYDRLDTLGKMSFRRAGRMHHLGIGYAHARTRVLAIADDTTITVIELDTGEILSTHNIDPDRNYWRNTQRTPGRWPGVP